MLDPLQVVASYPLQGPGPRIQFPIPMQIPSMANKYQVEHSRPARSDAGVPDGCMGVWIYDVWDVCLMSPYG